MSRGSWKSIEGEVREGKQSWEKYIAQYKQFKKKRKKSLPRSTQSCATLHLSRANHIYNDLKCQRNETQNLFSIIPLIHARKNRTEVSDNFGHTFKMWKQTGFCFVLFVLLPWQVTESERREAWDSRCEKTRYIHIMCSH